MKNNRTLIYTLLNITYFAAFCTIHAYAAVYLLAHGFTNTQVGILLAIANVISALCQPIVAGIIDKQGWLTNRRLILISVLIILAGSLILMAVQDNRAVIFVVYSLIYTVQFIYQPVMTALCFEYQKAGYHIFFGLARGLGSAGFAVTSAIIGSMIEKKGEYVLLIVNVIMMVISAVLIFTFRKPVSENQTVSGSEPAKEGTDSEIKATEDGRAHNSLKEFSHIYPAFTLYLVGVVCFFFAHNMINDFMIQIIRNLGGTERDLGYCGFLQAILELPVMALIGLVLKKISARNLMLISGTAFLVKIFLLIFAHDMTMMYISQCWQLFAYAVFIPATAYYVSETMEELDQVKGQAFITSAITVGGVFSTVVSGRMLDKLGVKPMLIAGTVVCALGVIIAFIAIRCLSHKNDD